MLPAFVLIHSPLVGPTTWNPVADALSRHGIETFVPVLGDNESWRPYWEQHAMSISTALEATSPDTQLILVGHSGAGPLLPAVRQIAHRAVAGYIFVDAGIPMDGLSRLDLMALESTEFAARFRDALLAGERFPNWSDDDLRDVIPDVELRHQLVSELCPRSLTFFEEPIPVFAGWPDAPCAYLQFTPTYNVFAAQAQTNKWIVRRLEGEHFHMLVDADAVERMLIDLMDPMTAR